MKKIIYSLIIMLLISVMLISSYYIYTNQKEDNKQQEIFKELSNIVVETEQEKEDKIDFKELYKINEDLVGWLKIEDTNIDYPIMQTNNTRKDYYLYRNFYKEYSQLGTPYIAEYCNIEKDDNIIIYGHNIIGQRIFGELEKYKKKEYFENHKIIKFYTINELAEYEIIAVFKTTAYNGFKYYKFYNTENESEFNAFIQKCKELAFYNIENTAIYGDKLITLSTCDNSTKNGRLVVIAKKIIK